MFTSIFLKCGNSPCIVTDDLSEVQNYLKNTYQEEDCLFKDGYLFFGEELHAFNSNAVHYMGKPVIVWKKGKPNMYRYPSVIYVHNNTAPGTVL